MALAALPAAAQTPFEARVLAALNAARAEPAAYADALRRFRGFFHANLLDVPGTDEVETEEGAAPLDEAVRLLVRQPALAPVAAGATLAAAAADHAAEQARSGALGHGGGGGSSPSERVMRHGGGEEVAEAIMYGAADADDVVRQLLIDDGVADRGHRTLLLAPELRYAGVACRPHPLFRTVCVIDLARTPDGRAGALRMAAWAE